MPFKSRFFLKVSLFLYTQWVCASIDFCGGTLSAPTGCSPRGYGGLLAVDHSLYTFNFFTRLIGSSRGATRKTGGGTLSAPTGCSPRGYGGLLAVDHSLYTFNFLTRLIG